MKNKLVTGGYYHVYNRGVDKREIFCDSNDYQRFLKILVEFNRIKPIGSLFQKQSWDSLKSGQSDIRNPNQSILGSQGSVCRVSDIRTDPALVSIICYCLLSNHYHLLLRQEVDGGISEFMKRIGIGYTNYFNIRNNRSGCLFQGKYKAKEVDTNESLLWLSFYINGNMLVHQVTHEPEAYAWSSYNEYCSEKKGICNLNIIMEQYDPPEKYKTDLIENIPEILKQKELQDFSIE